MEVLTSEMYKYNNHCGRNILRIKVLKMYKKLLFFTERLICPSCNYFQCRYRNAVIYFLQQVVFLFCAMHSFRDMILSSS